MPSSNFLGEDYDYIKAYYNPNDCAPGGGDGKGPCMGKSGNKIFKNISGTLNYGNALLFHEPERGETGYKSGGIQKTKGVLGNKYVINTGIECATATGETVERHIGVNNRPSGDIPFIGDLVKTGGIPKGLIPGMLSNIDRLNPVKLLSALVPQVGEDAICRERSITEITQTSSGSNKEAKVNVHMTDSDYNEYVETFENIYSDVNEIPANDYSSMPNDILMQLYLSTLTIMGMYIVLKLINK
jgi:hypothetical protein